ncbi:MAG TPA: aldehyde ferredoxin oxidoreductase family protein [Dehalococcoidia bacterium]|nr:aldehyde ferredoxin oxidoreductase family protein [Dehalococcoidia bacterium]
MTKESPAGYNGRILRVNLSNKSTTAEAIDELFCRRYIGGAGFITYYLWKELRPGVDALAPDNKLIFALGPISGLQLPGAARHCIGAKSPLTGGIAKAEAGGFWAAELKRAGYDAIIVEGRAETPVYLWIQDGEASIRDANHLWGKETKETEAAIRAELDDERIQMALIGPGGENKVRYACIMQGLYDAAARGGLGAVMGSKNLKAIAVRGHNLPRIADRERLKEIRQEVLAAPPHWLSALGTGGPSLVEEQALGNLPVRNFRDGLFPEAAQIHSGVMKETMWVGMEGCFACPVRCKKVVQFEEPYHVDAAYGAPEYESIAALGSNCGMGNLKAVVKANERCGAYSLDTISTGGTLAFAMECFEKGLLTTKDTDGIDLRFGNHEAMLKVIDLIARREGIGNLLAEGSARLAQKIGQGSEEFAMQVKGLEAGMHEPRLSPCMGLGFMVNPHGADHVCALIDFFFFSSEGMLQGMHPLGIIDLLPIDDIGPRKVALFRLDQLNKILGDCLATCLFLEYSLDKKVELVKAATGWDTGIPELLRVAERVLTMARLFNIREGFSAADDVLPERFFQPKTDGALADKALDREKFEKAKSFYYTLMGWDAKGVPLPEKVEELYIE